MPPTTDRFTIRAVAIGLIFTILAVVGALTYSLAAVTLTPQEQGVLLGVIGSLGTGALGAVGALLASTRSQDPAQAPAPPALPEG